MNKLLTVGIDETLIRLRAFVSERDWQQFHTPENLAKSVSIEAAELLECFQWNSDANREATLEELADVLTYCFLLADKLGENPLHLIEMKLKTTAKKYSVEKSRGKSEKYDRL